MQSPKNLSAAATSAGPGAQSSAAEGSGSGAVVAEREVGGGEAREALPPSPSTSNSSSSSSGDGGDGGSAAATCVFARRVGNLPVVQALLRVYVGAKGYPCVGWALAVGEQAALLAAVPAAVLCKPVAGVCRAPVACADWCLCKALDAAETFFPCVSMPPSQVYDVAMEHVENCLCCPPRTAARCVARVCPGSAKH